MGEYAAIKNLLNQWNPNDPCESLRGEVKAEMFVATAQKGEEPSAIQDQ